MHNLARLNDPQTSHDAAASIEDSVARQEAMIYDVLSERGSMNAEMIAEAICDKFRWQPDSVAVCRRLKGMERRGVIRYMGYTMPQSSGRRARAMGAV